MESLPNDIQSNNEEQYILGTEQAELHRLGLQHQIWASEARRGWEVGGFRSGHKLLDLGCGPGFCTLELAYLVGNQGRVIGVDFASGYIAFLRKLADFHALPIELQACSFEEMQLEPESLDGVFVRWALAWVSDPESVLARVLTALKPGGRMVIQEYFDWSVFQSEPALPHFKKAIAACYRSMKEQTGDIDVGRRLPALAAKLGMKIVNTRSISKFTGPTDQTWLWPDSFLRIYLPKIAERGFLTPEEARAAITDLDELGRNPEARILCPLVVEVVLER